MRQSLTSLRCSILLGLRCHLRNLWHIRPWLLHNVMNCLLLWVKHGVSGSLHLKTRTLHQKLGTLVLEQGTWNLHWGMVWEWGPNKLTRLRDVGLGVASGMLTQKTHLALAILLHFVQFVLNDDCFVNQTLTIRVVGVQQLKLDLILETLEKCVLLPLIRVHIVGGIPKQLNELIKVFIHHHIPLIQF
jgi:hypothetical protein